MGALRMCSEFANFANFTLMARKAIRYGQCIKVYCQRMVRSLLWITHCWCCVFLMCNARAIKAGVAASNVALKLNLEHLEHN